MDEYGIVLPDDYNPKQERYVIATVVSCATDVRFCHDLDKGKRVLVDQSMIEEIDVNNGQITVVLDNYVVGLFED